MAEEPVDGFEVDVHRALTEPLLWAGAPRMFTICNLVITMEMVLVWHAWKLWLPLGLGLHGAAVALTKWDPQWPSVITRHLRTKSYYYS